MRLASSDGALVDLRPVRYQYGPPASGGGGGFDSDANWVVVEGRVQTADGRGHSFRDPCLMTDEMPKISRWLRAVADHRVPPMSPPFDERRLLAFTEPNVAFSVSVDHSSDVQIRVHLSLESLPPSLRGDDIRLYEYFVELTLTPEDIRHAAAAWDREIASFPQR